MRQHAPTARAAVPIEVAATLLLPRHINVHNVITMDETKNEIFQIIFSSQDYDLFITHSSEDKQQKKI